MFTLDRIASDPSQKVDRIGLLFTLKTAGSFQLLERSNVGTERCWKWTVPGTVRFFSNVNRISFQFLERSACCHGDLNFWIDFKAFCLYDFIVSIFSLIVDVTRQKVNRCCLESDPIQYDKVFTLERINLWTVPHSVPFQCEHGLKEF